MAMLAFEINKRQPLAGGRDFGMAGAYEQIDGTAHFGVDPSHPDNQGITDIALAPRNTMGRVLFSADATILTPRDPGRGNRKLLVDIPNRGNRLAMRFLNNAAPAVPGEPIDPGDGFLMRHGYTVAWCGWQHDVPDVPGLMRANVPDAKTTDGGPVRGPIMVSFLPNVSSQVQLLSDRAHRPYPTSDVSDPHAVLLEREADDAPPKIIPREQWSFARFEGGRCVPDPTHVYLAAGFVPGKLYHVVYTTTGAPVIGLGFLATRDFASFLRHDAASQDNPWAGKIQHAYAFGASQSGAFLRQYLWLGLHRDERERPVFDGYLIHIAGGGRGADFNMRFGQPSNTLRPRLRETPPFTDIPQTDPVTGRTSGLLDRIGAHQPRPKIFMTNSSNEYWRGDASLIHSAMDGSRDLEPSADVRIYHYAGTQHGSATWPVADSDPLDGTRTLCLMNTVDYRPLLRGAVVALDRWVSVGDRPPPSQYPRLADGTAVTRETTEGSFSGIPDIRFPTRLPRAARNDFGPETDRGVVTTLPSGARPVLYPALCLRRRPRRQRNRRHSFTRPDCAAGYAYRLEFAPPANRRAWPTDQPDRRHRAIRRHQARKAGTRRPSAIDRRSLPRQDCVSGASEAGSTTPRRRQIFARGGSGPGSCACRGTFRCLCATRWRGNRLMT